MHNARRGVAHATLAGACLLAIGFSHPLRATALGVVPTAVGHVGVPSPPSLPSVPSAPVRTAPPSLPVPTPAPPSIPAAAPKAPSVSLPTAPVSTPSPPSRAGGGSSGPSPGAGPASTSSGSAATAASGSPPPYQASSGSPGSGQTSPAAAPPSNTIGGSGTGGPGGNLQAQGRVLASPSHGNALRATVARLHGCLSALPGRLRVVLELRTGVGAPATLSPQRAAAYLRVSPSRIVHLEETAITQLLSVARTSGCAGGGGAESDASALAALSSGTSSPGGDAAEASASGASALLAGLPAGRVAFRPAGAKRGHGTPGGGASSGGGGAASPSPGAVVTHGTSAPPFVIFVICGALVLLAAIGYYLLPFIRDWVHGRRA